MNDEPDRTKLLHKVIETIAHETTSERIQREVGLLSDVLQCKPEKNEDPETYANKFGASIAKYIHQKNNRDPSDDHQWALLLHQNANQTAETRNSITFTLTKGAAMKKNNNKAQLVEVDNTEIDAISIAIIEAESCDNQEGIILAIQTIK